MNAGALIFEIAAVILGLFITALTVAVPGYLKRQIGALTFLGLGLILLFCYTNNPEFIEFAFNRSYALDGLALFSKKFFIITAMLVVLLLMSRERDGLNVATENYGLIVFALVGMMFTASANNLIMLFVSIELVTVSFYILTAINKQRESLEAGIKYLIFGGVSSAFLIFGIALVYGISGEMGFKEISSAVSNNPAILHSALFQVGAGMILVGIGFKIAMVPVQLWVPDVYQGAPSLTTAFLATGSKAAGFIALIRLLLYTTNQVAAVWREQLIALSIITILYGNLCAIPQRNIKRLIGYSSIAHAGYLLMGIASINPDGTSSILFYLATYMLAVIAVFGVISALNKDDNANNFDISLFSALHHRSPFLGAVMTIALASLAGIPPLAGFFGKFLLIKSALLQSSLTPAYYYLIGAAIAGVAISIYYYFGIIKLIYWGEAKDYGEVKVSFPLVILLAFCVAGILYLGVSPSGLIESAKSAAKVVML